MIEFSARERHFVDHLAPVWREIPEELRGAFYVGEGVTGHALELGIEAVEGYPRRSKTGGPVVCSSWGDLRVCQRTGRQTVLMEHGAGQTYSNRHTSYAGGKGRDRVALLVCPNEHAASRNRRRYPYLDIAVIGSPRVDELRALGGPLPGARPAVAISFHWRCEVVPETYSALDHYAAGFEDLRAELDFAGVELLGHAHPRILDELRPIYEAAGIEVVEDFADVVRRAHVYAVDNSSTLFEFAALDRPVVVLNAPHFRRTVEHGLRFWRDASIGLNVDGPSELAGALLDALDDPPELARLRSEALERIYPVRDGTSALRAARSIVNLYTGRRTCIVCGSAGCACGPATNVVAVDERIRGKSMKKSPLKRYPNPAKPGAFLKLTEEEARRQGLAEAPAPASPPPAPARQLGADGEAPPKGALAKGGPTARARAEAKALAEAKAAEELEGEELEGEDEPDRAEAPATKKRPAPTPSNRRRRASTAEKG